MALVICDSDEEMSKCVERFRSYKNKKFDTFKNESYDLIQYNNSMGFMIKDDTIEYYNVLNHIHELDENKNQIMKDIIKITEEYEKKISELDGESRYYWRNINLLTKLELDAWGKIETKDPASFYKFMDIYKNEILNVNHNALFKIGYTDIRIHNQKLLNDIIKTSGHKYDEVARIFFKRLMLMENYAEVEAEYNEVQEKFRNLEKILFSYLDFFI